MCLSVWMQNTEATFRSQYTVRQKMALYHDDDDDNDDDN